MRQSRLMSLAEGVANIMVGYGLAVLTQHLVFPAATLGESLAIAAIFTVVSLARNYLLRRLFERMTVDNHGR